MADITLTATLRDKVSSDKLVRARKEGKIPAIVYGNKVAPQMVWVDFLTFSKVHAIAGESSIIALDLEKGKKRSVIVQDLAYDAMTNRVAHIDFFEVSMNEELEARIPLEFINEAPAVRELGGILVKTLEEVTVTCLPKDLPHAITIDLAILVDFSVHVQVKDLVLPQGVKVLTDELTTIVLVEAPRTEAQMAALDEKVEADVTKVEGVVKEADPSTPSVAEAKKEGKKEEKK
ncbi:MAG: 50S ribosomal protein L25 [Candidatus Moranbacteria bacterium]|jgi:large subunit ribosomal protein L25|nr:50S ribosomal protein L25 [Candidatus Moranbacteria bacterium]